MHVNHMIKCIFGRFIYVRAFFDSQAKIIITDFFLFSFARWSFRFGFFSNARCPLLT